MKSKSLILMIVAMGCGLVAAYTTAKLTAKGQDETEKVLVANSEIKIGTVIKEPEKLFVEIDYRKGTAPNAVTDIEKIKDKVVTRTVRPGQFIVPDDLSANFGITPPKGTKAMSIKVTPDAAVAGFIMPGSRVDVLATIGDQNSKPKTIMVLQNQEVLAVDRISVRPDGASAVESINTVTLAVTPQHAQKLELALKYSNNVVRLLLRSQDDTTTVRLTPRDSVTGNDNDFAGGDGSATGVRALAAREDINAGTVIDDPEKFFTPVAVAAAPASGYLEGDLVKLKGQTVKVPIFKDAIATAKHFEGKGVPVASTVPQEPTRHVLFIQNGGKEPQRYMYEGGVLLNIEPGSQPASSLPAPRPEPKKEEAAPPEHDDKSEKPAAERRS